MATTGIRLRRKPTKGNFTGLEAPVIGELIMSTDTTEFGWLDETDTVVWGRLENELPVGGTTGQVLAKSLNNDYEVEWIDAASGGSSIQRTTTKFLPIAERITVSFPELNGVLIPEEGNYLFHITISMIGAFSSKISFDDGGYIGNDIVLDQSVTDNTSKILNYNIVANDGNYDLFIGNIECGFAGGIPTFSFILNELGFAVEWYDYFTFTAEYIETQPIE